MSKKDGQNASKEVYQRLRRLPWHELWEERVPEFDRSPAQEREKNVGLVRAVGVVFSESGDPQHREQVARWLRHLLRDDSEKIRRYAMAALPKTGAGQEAEADLIELLESTSLDREKKFLARSLDKVGGAATLAALGQAAGLPARTEQKVRASLAREHEASTILLDRRLAESAGLSISLRGRRGLEGIVQDEASRKKAFRITGVRPGLVTLAATAPFSLSDLLELRCFGTLGIVLGKLGPAAPGAESLAPLITSPLARMLFRGWTDGPARYRLEFVGRGHQRGLVRDVAEQAYTLCPDILNDARSAPWSVDVHLDSSRTVELRPRFSPDPRFSYRQEDIPAASHPPLAAGMARLAGPCSEGILWDPFCGSGLELIERARLGGIRQVFGSDRSREAVAIAEKNYASAGPLPPARFFCCDFREFSRQSGLAPGSVDQIISNPPLGRRVPILNLPGLIRDLLAVSNALLRPGGSLVFANPVPVTSPFPSLRRQTALTVDFGGFDCRLEHYKKVPAR